MTTDELIAVLKGRGLQPRLRNGNRLAFTGPQAKEQWTPALQAAIKWHRDELIRRLGGEPAPPARIRQWLFPDGLLVLEKREWASYGDESHHPGLAGWWRYQGETVWREIDGRAEHVAGKCPEQVFRSAIAREQAQYLERSLPGPRGPESIPGDLGGDGSTLPEPAVQSGLFGSGDTGGGEASRL